MSSKKALILIDLQNDFCSGGSLAVPGGDEIIVLANTLQTYFDCIIATQDWHPQDHLSFAANHRDQQVSDEIILEGSSQVLWPSHCVQYTQGAEFHPMLNTQKVSQIFYKGIDKNIDSYSAFFDNAHLRSTGLGEYLRRHHIQKLYFMGLATDYCVKHSVLDALQLGFDVYVIEDACRGVELKKGDIERAKSHMKMAGVHFIHSSEVMSG